MKEFVLGIYHNTEWLYTKLIELKLFFIDLWSFEHFYSGILISVVLISWAKKNRWIILFSILFSYEIFEILIRYFALHIFLPETIKDQFTDIILGLLGGLFVELNLVSLVNRDQEKKKIYIENIVALLISVQISFWWVGSSKYEYNYSFLNSAGINFAAFFAWSTGLFIVYKIYSSLNRIITNNILSFGLHYLIYLFLLFTFELLTYNVLGIKEISNKEKTPLIFNLIHGTTALHVAYFLLPAINCYLINLFIKVSNKAQRNYILIKNGNELLTNKIFPPVE